jgi:hypothetical protein
MNATSYGIELSNGLELVKLDEWRVLRRFVDGNRVVLVLCTLAELTEFEGVPVKGIRVLERAFVVLRPSPSDSPECRSTLMQTCYRSQPTIYQHTPGLEETLAALTDFLFAYIAGTVSVNNQMIEKALRAQAAQSRTDVLLSPQPSERRVGPGGAAQAVQHGPGQPVAHSQDLSRAAARHLPLRRGILKQ